MNFFFVAGFDFGTSYSKVVLRDQFTGVAKVVTFGKSASGLLPSLVRVGDSQVAGPGGLEQKGILLSYPKLIAADAASGKCDFSSLYGDSLKDVLTQLRAKDVKGAAHLLLTRYFLSVLDGIHDSIAGDEDWKGFNPEADPLVVQIAVPTGLMSDGDKSVDKLMQGALASATLMRNKPSQSSPVSTVDELWAATKQLGKLSPADREALDTRCITYPEVAAGVQTVLRSRNTPDGKYITLDVGAGTVDINAFLRRSRDRDEDNPGLDYWACEVEPLGFARLNLGKTRTNVEFHETTVNPLPEPLLLARLGETIGRLMGNAFRFQPHATTGSGPSPWRGETYAYAWGGGAAHQPYLDQFRSSLNALRLNIPNVNLLPSPGDHFTLPADLEGNFGRLAVAYGLSYHQANLEAVRLPHQIKSFEELHPVRWKDAYRGKTGICSCRGNPACPACFGAGFIDPKKELIPRWLPSGFGTNRHPTAHRISRFELALDNLIRDYHGLGHRIILADRVRRMNEINELLKRPEVQKNHGLVTDAQHILLHNLALFKGRIRLQTLSAVPTTGGCRAVVNLHRRLTDEMVILHPKPDTITVSINVPPPPDYLELGCIIQRNDRGKFFLKATEDVASPPSVPAGPRTVVRDLRQNRRPNS
ncbi:hypothetical protein [Luteolibacter soli]|uniref:Uncharacterized protein n=1 Tax=Luteolibacter soli TaxID=3135280 RepID=A0ABU9ATS0_9BACT